MFVESDIHCNVFFSGFIYKTEPSENALLFYKSGEAQMENVYDWTGPIRFDAGKAGLWAIHDSGTKLVYDNDVYGDE